MNSEHVAQQIRAGVGESALRVLEESEDRLRIFTPFQYSDGDHLVIVARRDGDRWCLSDEAHSLMRLSYTMDLETLNAGPRRRIFEGVKTQFDLREWRGELVRDLEEDSLARQILEFSQALIQIHDIEYLRQERVRSTFKHDVRDFVFEAVAADCIQEQWHYRERDPDRKYSADYRIEAEEQPLFLFALSTTGRTRKATISVLQYQKWGMEFVAAGIFESRDKVSKTAISQFNDAANDDYDFGVPMERARARRELAAIAACRK